MGRPSRSVALFRYECAPDMKDIFALKLYTRVARLGSFSAAARECNLSQSQASRIVAELEESLGTRLLSRTCVYRKLKHGRSGDEVRPGRRVN